MKTFAKILSVLIACTMVFVLLASCNQNETTQNTETKGIETTTTQKEETETTGKTQEETTTKENETTEKPGEKTYLDTLDTIEYYDNKTEKIGSYVNLVYSEEFCKVETDVKQGLGASETVKITVTMKDGYIFDGFTKDDLIDNINGEIKKASDQSTKDNWSSKILTKENVCSFEASDDVTIYLNYSLKIVYHANGGTVINGGDTYETTYPLSYYKCPVTEKFGMFSRDGYVLSEYCTKADGTGTRASLGSRIKSNGSTLDLYCIWEKASDVSNFKYSGTSKGIVIEEYLGDETNVVIPETINGSKVVSISDYSFTSDKVERLFVPAYVTSIGRNALDLSNLKELVLHDSIISMTDEFLSYSTNLTSLRINSTLESFEDWCRGTYQKLDRLVWAKDMRKIVIYGGSGTWYGWDSPELVKAYGDKYVIINLGANANMCSCAFMEGISAYLNDGDILLWAPEPGASVLGDTYFDGGARSWWFTFSHFDLYKNVDVSAYENMFQSFASFNRNHANKQWPVERCIAKNNIYGDANATENKMVQASYRFNYFDGRDYSHMSNVIDNLNKKGVKVLFTYAAMAEEGINGDFSGLEEFKNNILKNFDVEIISDYENCLYPIKYFHDSEWHMINAGATMRTLRVIEDLDTYFESLKGE